MIIQISAKLKKLAKLFPNKLYVVGGYVRNSVMGIKLEDIDLCSSATLDEISKALADSDYSVKVKSKNLGTAIISCGNESYEYSTFRREVYADNGQHTPEKVEFIDDVAEDAKRRDFTINALYYDILKDEILDFYQGIDDIRNKIMRTVETPDFVMSKDGARILRLFRFACELNFKIDRPTLVAAYKYAKNVQDISTDRKVNEITKILHSPTKYKISKPNAFMKAFKIFNKAQLWSSFGFEASKIKFNMIKKVEHKSQGFLIDLIDTVNPISISYYLEKILLDNMKMSRKYVRQIINILSGYYAALNKLENKPYFFKYFDNFPSIYLLISKKSKILAMKYEFFYKYIISHKLVISVKELKITGEDIKKYYPEVNPKRYRAILESLLSDVFDSKLANEKRVLIAAINQKLKYL